MRDPSNLLLGQPDGTFVEGAEAAGIVTFDRGRGAALVDLNLDGLLDLVQANLAAPVRVWRNVGAGTAEAPAAMGNWIAYPPRAAGRRTATRSGPWSRSQAGDRITPPASSPSAAGTSAASSAGPHVGSRAGDRRAPGPGHLAGRRGRAVADGPGEPVRGHRARVGVGRCRGRRPEG